MVRALVGLFGRSPFAPLAKHIEGVTSCVDLVLPLMEAVLKRDAEEIARLRKAITHAEHEADLVKNELRDHLPRSLFLPVSRTDLLELLHHQDDLADGAEDAAVLASMKTLAMPAELHGRVRQYTELCIAAAHTAQQLVSRLDELRETGFSGPEAEQIHELIDRVGQQEWQADKAAFKLLQELFRIGTDVPPIDLVLWMKLCGALGDIANGAEQVGEHLRLMLAR